MLRAIQRRNATRCPKIGMNARTAETMNSAIQPTKAAMQQENVLPRMESHETILVVGLDDQKNNGGDDGDVGQHSRHVIGHAAGVRHRHRRRRWNPAGAGCASRRTVCNLCSATTAKCHRGSPPWSPKTSDSVSSIIPGSGGVAATYQRLLFNAIYNLEVQSLCLGRAGVLLGKVAQHGKLERLALHGFHDEDQPGHDAGQSNDYREQ